MRRIHGDGVELALIDEGEGPPVLLLHGFPDSSHLWRGQIPALNAAGLRTVAPDLRGFGESDKPQDVEAYSVGRSIADVLAILDELGIERAHVVGHDWGAGVAWALALFVPDRVDKLVVMSVGHPAMFARPPLAQREKSWYMLFFQFPEAEALLEKNDWALMRQWSASHPDFERVFADLQRPGALTAALNWYRANVHPRNGLQSSGPLPPVQADTLGIWSTGDAYLLEHGMKGSGEHVAGMWRYERVEGASHWLQLDAPERVNELLIDFLC